MNQSECPFVSVVVPVFNAAPFIGKLLDALMVQDYPQDKREFIIVDNGSKDDTKAIVAKYPVLLLEENDIQSSYAARNKGISSAKGRLLAFTDADCIARPDWISQAVSKMISENADLAAGKVEFEYSPKPTVAEIYDSITHMQIDYDVIEKSSAPTANLFVNRKVFEQIGVFNQKVKSGGDIQWTKKATASGFKLIYCELAAVSHPTRSYCEFIKKITRTAVGSAHSRLAAGHSILHEFFYMPYAIFFKVKVDKQLLKDRFMQRGLDGLNVRFSNVFVFGVICSIFSHFIAMLEFWRILFLIAIGRYKIKQNERD